MLGGGARSQTGTRSAAALACTLALCALVAGGCSVPQGGTVTTTGLGDNPVRLESTFDGGTFAVEPAQTTVVFSSIPYTPMAEGTARDGQFLHIEVLWRPKAGQTPVQPEATNLSIRLVVVSHGEVGVYGGGGFGWITGGTEDDDEIGIEITGSSIALIDHTPGFADLLSPAAMLGELGATKDADRARAYRRAASQMVTNRLGRVRWVDSRPATVPGSAGAGQS